MPKESKYSPLILSFGTVRLANNRRNRKRIIMACKGDVKILMDYGVINQRMASIIIDIANMHHRKRQSLLKELKRSRKGSTVPSFVEMSLSKADLEYSKSIVDAHSHMLSINAMPEAMAKDVKYPTKLTKLPRL